jgi:predicted RNase H-like HicB family nuclease
MGEEAIAVWITGNRRLGLPVPEPKFFAMVAV